MTRVAFIGSSHLVAIRAAEAEIRAARPDLDITFFALTGGLFFRSRIGPDGIFRPGISNKAEARRVQRLNGGKSELDLAGVTYIWVIGHRFGLRHVLDLLRRHDVLGWRKTKTGNPVSESFFRAAINDLAARQVAAAADLYAHDPRVVFSPAPYPATLAAARGPRHEAGSANVQRHPEAARVFRMFESAIAERFAETPCKFMPQPHNTLDSPFATKNDYLASAESGDIDKMKEDVRHMNAAFGLAMFSNLAELHLPAPSDMPKFEAS